MKQGIVLDELYKFSEKFDATFDGEVLTIDNFYQDPEKLYDHISNRDYPMWKYTTERNTRNGQDYMDCRITDKVAHPTRVYFNDYFLEQRAKVWGYNTFI